MIRSGEYQSSDRRYNRERFRTQNFRKYQLIENDGDSDPATSAESLPLPRQRKTVDGRSDGVPSGGGRSRGRFDLSKENMYSQSPDLNAYENIRKSSQLSRSIKTKGNVADSQLEWINKKIGQNGYEERDVGTEGDIPIRVYPAYRKRSDIFGDAVHRHSEGNNTTQSQKSYSTKVFRSSTGQKKSDPDYERLMQPLTIATTGWTTSTTTTHAAKKTHFTTSSKGNDSKLVSYGDGYKEVTPALLGFGTLRKDGIKYQMRRNTNGTPLHMYDNHLETKARPGSDNMEHTKRSVSYRNEHRDNIRPISLPAPEYGSLRHMNATPVTGYDNNRVGFIQSETTKSFATARNAGVVSETPQRDVTRREVRRQVIQRQDSGEYDNNTPVVPQIEEKKFHRQEFSSSIGGQSRKSRRDIVQTSEITKQKVDTLQVPNEYVVKRRDSSRSRSRGRSEKLYKTESSDDSERDDYQLQLVGTKDVDLADGVHKMKKDLSNFQMSKSSTTHHVESRRSHTVENTNAVAKTKHRSQIPAEQVLQKQKSNTLQVPTQRIISTSPEFVERDRFKLELVGAKNLDSQNRFLTRDINQTGTGQHRVQQATNNEAGYKINSAVTRKSNPEAVIRSPGFYTHQFHKIEEGTVRVPPAAAASTLPRMTTSTSNKAAAVQGKSEQIYQKQFVQQTSGKTESIDRRMKDNLTAFDSSNKHLRDVVQLEKMRLQDLEAVQNQESAEQPIQSSFVTTNQQVPSQPVTKTKVSNKTSNSSSYNYQYQYQKNNIQKGSTMVQPPKQIDEPPKYQQLGFNANSQKNEVKAHNSVVSTKTYNQAQKSQSMVQNYGYQNFSKAQNVNSEQNKVVKKINELQRNELKEKVKSHQKGGKKYSLIKQGSDEYDNLTLEDLINRDSEITGQKVNNANIYGTDEVEIAITNVGDQVYGQNLNGVQSNGTDEKWLYKHEYDGSRETLGMNKELKHDSAYYSYSTLNQDNHGYLNNGRKDVSSDGYLSTSSSSTLCESKKGSSFYGSRSYKGHTGEDIDEGGVIYRSLTRKDHGYRRVKDNDVYVDRYGTVSDTYSRGHTPYSTKSGDTYSNRSTLSRTYGYDQDIYNDSKHSDISSELDDKKSPVDDKGGILFQAIQRSSSEVKGQGHYQGHSSTSDVDSCSSIIEQYQKSFHRSESELNNSKYREYYSSRSNLGLWCLQPQELESQNHNFRNKSFKKPRNCGVCNQLVWNSGSVCRVCKNVVHKKCEGQVVSPCQAPVNYELQKNVAANKQTPASRSQLSSLGSSSHSSLKRGKLGENVPGEIDLTYITERIIAMSFAHEGQETLYRNNLKDVAKMLKSKHGENYMIVNLSEKRPDITKLNPQVLDYGWPDHLAPPLERLCSICKSIDSWLNSDPAHVAVVHCKGGTGRTGVVIAAFMHYSSICASGGNTLESADQALDRFAMKRFYDDKLGGLTQPSQRRYVHYFAGLLSGGIKINSNPLFFHNLVIHGIPNMDGRGGSRPFVKIYQGMQPVHTTGVYSVSDGMKRVCMAFNPCLQLRGDVLIKCYHKRQNAGARDVIFRCQFHTCAISDYVLNFTKSELDDACQDSRFPVNGRVELFFSPGPERLHGSEFLSDAVASTEEVHDSLVRCDSYENFNNISNDVSFNSISGDSAVGSEPRSRVMPVQHVDGPVDGNLYAKVTRTHTAHNAQTSHATHSNRLANGGPGLQPNGPLNMSHDSGISSSAGLNSNNNQKQISMEDQTQLDEILNELLSDNLFQSPPPKSTSTPAPPSGDMVPSHGSLSTNSGNTRTVVSWETSVAGPKKLATVQQSKSHSSPGNKWSSDMITHTEVSQNGYSSQRQFSATQKSEIQGRVTSPTFRGPSDSPLPQRYNSVPYRVDYENRSDMSDGWLSDGDTNTSASWLAVQKQRLYNKKEGKPWQVGPEQQRTKQEKMLVAELKTAQSRIKSKRAISDVEEQMVIDQYVQSDQDVFAMNGPSHGLRSPSPDRATPVFSRPPKSPSPDRNFVNERKIQVSSPTPNNYKQVEYQFGLNGPVSPEREKRSYHTESYEKRFLGERSYSSMRPTSPDRMYQRTAERQSRPLERGNTMPKRSYSLEHTYDLEASRTLSPEPRSPAQATNRAEDTGTFRFRTTSPRPVVRSASMGGHYHHKRSHSFSEAGSAEKSEKTYYVSGLERPAFTTHQTKYVFSVSPPKASTAKPVVDTSGKTLSEPHYTAPPPPQPTPYIPQRTSSREFMARQRSMRQEWGSHGRKLSDNSYDRDPPYGRASPLTHSTATQPLRTQPLVDAQIYSPNYSMPSSNSRDSPPVSVVEEHLVKMTVPKVAADYAAQLEELEKSISQPVMATGYESSDFPDEPEEIEEEVISLHPIGQGIQTIEPDKPPSLDGRTTPGFPISATPPFPRSPSTPGTPYVNRRGPVTPTSPQSPPRMQQQQQHVQQHQQFATQQHQQQQHNQQQQHQGRVTPYQQQMVQHGPGGPQPVIQQSYQQQQQSSQQHFSSMQQSGAPGQDPVVQQQSYQKNEAGGQFYSQQHGQAPQHGGFASMDQQYHAQQHGGGMIPQNVSSATAQHAITGQGMPQGMQQQGMQQIMPQQVQAVQAAQQHSQESHQSAEQLRQQFMQARIQQGGSQSVQGQVGGHSAQGQVGHHSVQGHSQGQVREHVIQQQSAPQQHTTMNGYATGHSTMGGVSHGGTMGGVSHGGTMSGVSHGGTMSGVSHGGTMSGVSHGGTMSGVSHGGTMSGVSHGGTLTHGGTMTHGGMSHGGTLTHGGMSQNGTMGGVSHSGTMGGVSHSGTMGGVSHSGTMGGMSQTGTYGGMGQQLSVDTSQKMLQANMARSPSSAGSQGQFSSHGYSQQYSPATPSPGAINSKLSVHSSGPVTPGARSLGASSPYFGQSRGGSMSSLDGMGDGSHTTKFVRDMSKYWYKPHISREEAISMLKDKPPGTFVVRDSNSFPGAFGLALKVAQVPPNVQTKATDPQTELVRHFLIETTPKGVKLKGCSNEPVFGSLAALVYQHSITPLALPCKLLLPEPDGSGLDMVDGDTKGVPSSAAALLSQGAACNVVYLNTIDMESLTGSQAIGRAVNMTINDQANIKTTVVHFKVSSQGITLTDSKRKLFFRRHYPVNTVTYCGTDPQERRWTQKLEDGHPLSSKIFGFVARKQGSNSDNQCHIFAELDPDQPASAIVNFITKVMIGAKHVKGSS